MDKIIGIELDRWGFTIDSQWLYISIGWQLIGIATAALIVWRIYKRSQRVF